MKWSQTVESLTRCLSPLEFTLNGKTLEVDLGFSHWAFLTNRVRETNGTVYLVGNGASASMASHFAADLAKNGHLHTQVFSDICLVTAVSNDISFEDVYSEPLRRRGKEGDLLVAISSSGRSANILRCVEMARNLKLTVVTVSGFEADNSLRKLGDLNAYVPAHTYSLVETAHAAVLHGWMDLVDQSFPVDAPAIGRLAP